MHALCKLATLKQGWHYGEGDPITAEALSRARTLLGMTTGEVFPLLEGGIVLVVSSSEQELEFEIAPDGTVSYELIVGSETIAEDGDLTDEEIMSLVEATDEDYT